MLEFVQYIWHTCEFEIQTEWEGKVKILYIRDDIGKMTKSFNNQSPQRRFKMTNTAEEPDVRAKKKKRTFQKIENSNMHYHIQIFNFKSLQDMLLKVHENNKFIWKT